MALANPCWRASRILGELLKLGIDVCQATVAKYMARRRQPRAVANAFYRWTKIRQSLVQSRRRTMAPSWPFRKWADSIIATNDALPERASAPTHSTAKTECPPQLVAEQHVNRPDQATARSCDPRAITEWVDR